MLYYMVICYKRFMFNVLLLFSSQADRVVIGGDHFFRCRKRLKLVLIFLSLSFSIFTSLKIVLIELHYSRGRSRVVILNRNEKDLG